MYALKLQKKILPDKTRVIFQFFNPGGEARINNVINRVLSLSEKEAGSLIENILNDFSGRHLNIKHKLLENFNKVYKYINNPGALTLERKYLLGAYFSKEYSIEAASLFNPSIVPHPDQKNLKPGMLRFVLSLRATGEGHLSSIEFRTGIIDQDNDVFLDTPSAHLELPVRNENKLFTREFIKERIQLEDAGQKKFVDDLPDDFNLGELKKIADKTSFDDGSSRMKDFAGRILGLADSNYQIKFHESSSFSERIIFPNSVNESVGMEDARFVKFHDEDGSSTYFATYTAYNGKTFGTQLIETKDFLTFNISTLHGPGVQDKGMAIFPRRVSGKYVITSRQGGENLYIMFSDDLYRWDDFKLLKIPLEPWEYIQLGNCGSPIETEKGWLLITHAVGPFRKYSIGACLLDLHDPSKVIGTLRYPLIEPDEDEREGYVPNVVYSCGSLVHNGELIIPYAMSDSCTGLAKVPLEELLMKITL